MQNIEITNIIELNDIEIAAVAGGTREGNGIDPRDPPPSNGGGH